MGAFRNLMRLPPEAKPNLARRVVTRQIVLKMSNRRTRRKASSLCLFRFYNPAISSSRLTVPVA